MTTKMKLAQAMTALLVGTSLVACSGSGGGDSAATTETPLVISGSLASSFTAHSNSRTKVGPIRPSAINLSDLEIYVIAFTTPPTIRAADIGSDGSFSVSLPGAKGSQIMAVFRDKTSEVAVGTVTFKDTSKKDMDGNDQESSALTLSDSVNLGALSISDDGKVVVDVQTIADVVDTTPPAVSAAMDMGGNWTISKFTGTLPTGYETACATSGNNCHGPAVGENVFLIGLKGVEFTPGGGCTENSCGDGDGTATTTPVYALSFWRDSGSVNACGNKSGFTDAEARAHAGVKLTMPVAYDDNGTSRNFGFGHFTFTAPATMGGDTCVGVGNGICDEDWMATGAEAQWNMQDCTRKEVGNPAITVGVCKMIKTNEPTVYSAHVEGGGCFTSAGKPLMVDNWANITYGQCTNGSTNGLPTGFHSNTCTYTGSPTANAASQTFTCTWTHGNFDDANLSTPSNVTDMNGYTPAGNIQAGDDCNTITNDLNRYRCYAAAYWQADKSGNGCYKRYNFNWGATQVADFVMEDGREKPDNNFMTEKITYTPDGKGGVVSGHEYERIALNTGSTEAICEVDRAQTLNFKQETSTKVLVDMKTMPRLVNTSDATCVAYANKASCATNPNDPTCELYRRLTEEKSNMLFYLNK